MRKYWIIINNEVQRQFTQRFNIAVYAFGNISEIVSLIIIWSVVYSSIDLIKGYTAQEMISYVVFGWFFSFLTTTYSFEQNIARDIHLGSLSNFIVKPLSYVRYVVAVSLGRIFIAFLVVILQGVIIFSVFRYNVIFPDHFIAILLLVAMLVVTYFINLFLSILIGLIAFWVTEVSGVYYSLKVFTKLMSGSYFPINLLPAAFVNFSLMLPFAYTVFIPVQLYLGKISVSQGLKGLGVEIIWLFLLYGLIKLVWKIGLKKYESVGI